ncbi:DNA topoisomerase 2-beta [Rhipicephalus sanguineus]|uniref:DNA topoisomerase 2-beta n=1 Tax=Rhipicephalus sanguineus TaxID=34632 RepID=UPI0020C237C4|nr:DNA topoisomerase 2-beta [Rhipicephalus sanguineus]
MAKGSSRDKRLSVERIYQKMSQLEHVLLRPDTYVGSVEPVTQNMWVYDPEDENGGGGMRHRSVTFVPGLYKIFDEILVNAADNKQRDKNMDCIKVWEDNMRKTAEPKIKTDAKGEDFTKITFYPDLAKFMMEKLDADTVALLSRRAYDVAGCTQGVKVFLNGKRLPVKGFRDYAQLFLKDQEDETGNPLTVAHELVSNRWEVAVTLSASGEFRQMSFVNGIATTKGGSHVDYVSEHIVKKVLESVKKKNKAGVKILSKQVKDYLWMFVNCLIENPTFDSQTKENMTLPVKKFGSKCELSDKFYSQMLKCGVVESVMSWVTFKAEKQLGQKCSSKKHSKLKGIPKLEDANDAGTKNSVDCTLILTEGDSAKSLAVSGLSVVGRDKFGVFPLKGKILNVREATHKQILENAEINNVIKIMGLQYKKRYETMDDLKSLRYGRLMIMTDQDQDGSHIKGLLINFIHHNWPSLLKLPFLEEFITPIVKASRGSNELSFYSLPEFEEWKTATDDWQRWKVKYYKGLGTSTSKEAKEYFTDMLRHRITFRYQGNEDDHAIELAFSKKMIEQRKDWLRSGMEERKQRREMGLPELYLYGKDTKNVTYQDFVNKELILFSNMDNERSIPSLVDGLKPGQRKVLFTCFKRNDKREIKVAQLAGSVAEHSAYHHGEASLMSTIINLAQNFVGSNNINLLQPIGQFGTRLQGGKDAASPRYIFTMLSPLARLIVPALDDPILEYLYDDNQRIEPEYYIPVLPMVLVNGAEGIGTGWSTKIPNYNPRDIVANLRKMIAGEEPGVIKPWFKNFRGSVDQVEEQRFIMSGEVAVLNSTSIEITELPVRVWTQTYKETVLETMLHGTEKVPPLISDYKEYHTDTTVRFVVTMTEDKLAKAREEGLHKTFKLQTSLTTSSMVLFDSKGVLRTFRTPEDILRDFFATRLQGYERRKAYLVGLLSAEAKRLENQARFILEKIGNIIKIENRRRKEMMETLRQRGYDPDPIVIWKKQQLQQTGRRDSQAESQDEAEDAAEEQDEDRDKDGGSVHYNYLLGMPLWSLTMERKDDLLKKRDEKRDELEVLRRKSPENLWEEDLDAFLTKLDEVEKAQRDEENSTGVKATKGSKGGRSKAAAPKKAESETKPSAFAERVVPKVEWEAKTKATGARRGAKKATNDATADGHGDDGDGNAATATGRTSPEVPERATDSAPAKAPQHKRGGATKDKPSKTKAKKRKNSWSGSDSSENDESLISLGSDDDVKPVAGPSHRHQQDERQRAQPPKKHGAAAKTAQHDAAGGEADKDFVKPPAKKPGAISRTAKKASVAKQAPAADDSDSDPVPAPKKAAKKMRVVMSSSSDDDYAPSVPRPTTSSSGRTKAPPVKYDFGSDSDEF